MTRYDDILAAIGNTPLVGMPRMSPKPAVRLWAKLEGNNPTGSTKDRIALKMVETAEQRGDLTPDKTILEPTSGNTGIALAMVAARKGYRLTVVIPDNASEERIGLLRLFGAEIVFSDGEQGTNGSIEVARALARDDTLLHAVPVREPRESARTRRGHRGRDHRATCPRSRTSSPAWAPAARSPAPDAALHAHNPDIKVVAAEPELGDLVYGLRSLDDGFIPPIFDPDQVSRKFLVDSSSSLRTNRELTAKEGIFAGISSGAVVYVAQRIAQEIEAGRHRVPAARRRLEVPVDPSLGCRSWRPRRRAWPDRCGGSHAGRVARERPRAIGVFDSGVGGLTVARAILDLLPHEPLIYVGDTARFPYGPKPVDDIQRYALEVADYLIHRDVKMLVVACNSVEVSAIDDIAHRAGIPVVGVIDPGTRAAVRATRNGIIGLIGTQATVTSGAYDRAVASDEHRGHAAIAGVPGIRRARGARRHHQCASYGKPRAGILPR